MSNNDVVQYTVWGRVWRKAFMAVMILLGFTAWVYLDIDYVLSVKDDIAKMFADPAGTEKLKIAFSLYTALVLGLNVFWWFFISDALDSIGKLNENKTECNTSNATSGYSAG
jgi:hypothetical protein